MIIERFEQFFQEMKRAACDMDLEKLASLLSERGEFIRACGMSQQMSEAMTAYLENDKEIFAVLNKEKEELSDLLLTWSKQMQAKNTYDNL